MRNDFDSRLKICEDLIYKAETWASVALSNILHRARILLLSRSESELNAIAVDIREIIEEHDSLIDEASCEIWEKYEKRAPTRHSIPQMLRFCVGSVSLEERSVVDSPKWIEYFAVLALDSFIVFIESLNKNTESQDLLFDDVFHCDISCLMSYSDAHEAITMAESLDEDEQLSSEIGQLLKAKIVEKTKKQTQTAAQHKHKKTNDLLKELVDYYQKGNFKSMKAAVQAFLKETSEKKYNHLVPTNRERTLYNGLSDVLNGKRSID